MKNYVSDGKAITVSAPATVAAGEPVVIGKLSGVAIGDATSGDDVTIITEGVVSLPCNASVASGDAVEWDGSECVDLSAGTQIGVAVTAESGGFADVKIG